MRATTVPIVLVSGLLTWTLAGGCAPPPDPGDPLPGLTAQEQETFIRGRAVFERTFTAAEGLGPLFNADACAECHEDPVAGGPGDEVEIHAAALRADGTCDPLVEHGGPVVQQQVTEALRAALGIEAEPVPSQATGTARRTTPDILGFGLLDAVTDATILALADPDDRDGDAVSGRPNRFTDGRIGRFGRKAFVPTLREFNDGAFPIEQGITLPAAPVEETIAGRPVPAGVDPAPDPEIEPADLDLADFFVRALAPPAPRRTGSTERRGRRWFVAIGCAACHVTRLTTGPNPLQALHRRSVAAYTDLLLHDMGPDLADICLGQATPSEFRTEPLMGLRLSAAFLHDGRAATIEEAIRLHDGEGRRSRERFDRLHPDDRRTILAFLESL
jgi:CxxC motif-containing protein (DUF1111 family)